MPRLVGVASVRAVLQGFCYAVHSISVATLLNNQAGDGGAARTGIRISQAVLRTSAPAKSQPSFAALIGKWHSDGGGGELCEQPHARWCHFVNIFKALDDLAPFGTHPRGAT